MSNTPIPPKIKNQLLVKSGGRCQFRGCNQSLYKDLITKRDFNKSYIAHIVGDKSTGPRGDVIQSPILANALSNALLFYKANFLIFNNSKINTIQSMKSADFLSVLFDFG
jgi:hypothetical protein